MAEVVDLVAEEYALAADDIRTDVEAFLDDLAERGLVRPAEDSARA